MVSASILAGVAVIPAQAASLIDAILEYQNEVKPPLLAGAEIEASQNMNIDTTGDDSSLSQRQTNGVLKTKMAVTADNSDNSVPVLDEKMVETSEKYCPKCQQMKHREDAYFCFSCGSRILFK